MLVCMAPSSPPVKRTLHLLKTPDILLANDSRLLGSYNFGNTSDVAQPGTAVGRSFIRNRAEALESVRGSRLAEISPVLSIGFQGAAKRLSRCWRRPNSRIEGACHRLLRHHGVLRPHYQHHLARSGCSLLAGPPACVLRVTVRNGLLCGVSDFRHLFTAPRVSQITEYCRLPSV